VAGAASSGDRPTNHDRTERSTRPRPGHAPAGICARTLQNASLARPKSAHSPSVLLAYVVSKIRPNANDEKSLLEQLGTNFIYELQGSQFNALWFRFSRLQVDDYCFPHWASLPALLHDRAWVNWGLCPIPLEEHASGDCPGIAGNTVASLPRHAPSTALPTWLMQTLPQTVDAAKLQSCHLRRGLGPPIECDAAPCAAPDLLLLGSGAASSHNPQFTILVSHYPRPVRPMEH